MLIKSFEITIIGLIIVFIFLSLIVILVNISKIIIDLLDRYFPETSPSAGDETPLKQLKAVSGGKVLCILRKAGDRIKKDETIITIEEKNDSDSFVYFRMGTEREIKSPCNAEIKSIDTAEEANVISGQTLITIKPEREALSADKKSAPDGARLIKSPLPGTVLSVKTSPGSIIQKGDTVLTLEAMKMETAVKSDTVGKILSVEVKSGEQVETGQILVVVVD